MTDGGRLMLDERGNILSLPFDLTMPFARFIAHNGITNLRRYSVRARAFGLRKRERTSPSLPLCRSRACIEGNESSTSVTLISCARTSVCSPKLSASTPSKKRCKPSVRSFR